MKALFWIFLVANLLLFATLQWGNRLLDNRQIRLEQPLLHAEKIRLIDLPDSAILETQALSVPLETSSGVCFEWGDFSGADLLRATKNLAGLQLGNKLSQRDVEHNLGYWVYIPPINDKALLNQKIAQLKTRGIEEYFVVQEPGQWLNAISLGVFKTQEAAQKFTDELRKNDVRSARIGERNSKFKRTVFTLNDVDEMTRSKIIELRKNFPTSEIRNIVCN